MLALVGIRALGGASSSASSVGLGLARLRLVGLQRLRARLGSLAAGVRLCLCLRLCRGLRLLGGALLLSLGLRRLAVLGGLGLFDRRSLGVDRLRLLGLGRGRDQLLVDPPAPLGDPGRLADPAPQVVELRPPHVAARGDLEFLDLRRMQRKGPLDTDPEGLLADGEGLTRARALALEDDALEDLGPAAAALDHLEVDAHAVASLEGREPLPLLASLDAVDNAAHCSSRVRKKAAGAREGAARLRNRTYSAPRSNSAARIRLCSTRQLRTLSWSPETRTSGTCQPR